MFSGIYDWNLRRHEQVSDRETNTMGSNLKDVCWAPSFVEFGGLAL